MRARTGRVPRGGRILARFVRAAVLPAVIILAFLGAWTLALTIFDVPDYLVPTPLEVLQALVNEWSTIRANIGVTAIEAAGGFLVGNLVGIAIAVAFVFSRSFERAIYPVALAAQTIPIIALAPILVLIFGTGYTPKVIIGALLTFFPTLVNVARGLRSVEQPAFELMHVLSASKAQVFWKLRVPTSVPYLFAALRISAPVVVLGAIVSEWVGADEGLGYLILLGTYNYRPELLYAATLVGSLLAVAFFLAVVAAEHLATRWAREGSQGRGLGV